MTKGLKKYQSRTRNTPWELRNCKNRQIN